MYQIRPEMVLDTLLIFKSYLGHDLQASYLQISVSLSARWLYGTNQGSRLSQYRLTQCLEADKLLDKYSLFYQFDSIEHETYRDGCRISAGSGPNIASRGSVTQA